MLGAIMKDYAKATRCNPTFAGMLFRFLLYWVGLAMRAWFRRVYVSLEEPLPKDAPVIYACTHPNSAIDFLFLPIIKRSPVYVLVRGDVFQRNWLNKLFRGLCMLPVYRIRDGFSNLSRNADSFKECFSVFDRNGSVLIFSEGICIQEKTLQPLKKGTARLALDYFDRHGRDIYVVPMANNYTRFRQFRNSVMCNFGKPIRIADYRDLFTQNPNRAYQQLTDDIAAALDRLFIQVKPFDEHGWTEKALQALRLDRFEKRRSWMIHDRSVYEEERALVDRLNKEGDLLLSNEWKGNFEKLNVSFRNEGILNAGKKQGLLLAQMALLSPLMLLASLPHIVPYLCSRWITGNAIRDRIFYTTVMVLGSCVIYIVLWFSLLLVSAALWGWMGIVVSGAVLALSYIGIELIDEYRFGWFNRKNLRHMPHYRQLCDEVKSLVTKPQPKAVREVA